MKIGKYYWYEHRFIGNEFVKIDIGMTVPLWLEGKYRDTRRKYFDIKKRLGIKQK